MEPRVRTAVRCEPGGICALVGLIDEHRPALRFDFRDRFGLSLDDAGTKRLSWGEAADLVAGLVSDPSTRTCAAMQGWEYPFGRDLMLLADLFDLTQVIAADPKKRSRLETHPMRPWRDRKSEKFGNVAGRSRDEVEAILAAAAAGTLEAA